MSSQTYVKQRLSLQDSEVYSVRSFLKGTGNMLKRAFDFTMALIGLILLSPFLLIIGLLIKRDSPGPVFYWGKRMGRNGTTFRILKFRTMYEEPESYSGPRVTCKDDERITPFGCWLRDTKINEVPQLWNVLKGEMSLVGPRPEDPEIARTWPDDARKKILSVRPGITSPASVLYHDEEKLLSNKNALNDYYVSILPDKIRLDLLYVRHHTFFSDLDTIFWTAAVIIPVFARTQIPEGILFAGPISRLVRYYVVWFAIDLIGAWFTASFAAFLWRYQLSADWNSSYVFFLGVLLALVFSGINSITRLNRVIWSHATAEDMFGLLFSGTCATGVILGLNYLVRTYHWVRIPGMPLGMVIVIGLISVAWFTAVRYHLRVITTIASRWLAFRGNTLSMGDRVLIVGDGEAGQIATWLLGRQMFRDAFSIVGVVNEGDPTKYGMRVNGNWMLGSLKDLPKVIKKYDVGVILSAGESASRQTNEFIFDICQENQIRLFFLNDLMLMVDRQVTVPRGSFEYPVWLDERLEYKAMHNAVTGLPNRYLFQDRLTHSLAYAKRYKTLLAVLLIKIEGLDAVIEEIGRKYGDEILVEISRRLKKCARESDTLAYVSEGMFGVILQNISEESAAEMVARKLLAAICAPCTVEKRNVHLRAEIKIFSDSSGYNGLESLCKMDMKSAYASIQTNDVLKWYDKALDR